MPKMKQNPAIHDSPSAPLLQVTNLHFAYPEHALFEKLSILIPPGLSLLRGGDGSGKTTLLRLLAGELAADSGELRIQGVDLARDPLEYRQQVFWVDPRSDQHDQLSVLAYLDTVRLFYPSFDETLLAEAIAGLALAPHQDKALYMLSTGSKRKVWLAAAFASGATLTLLDEPLAALDKVSADFVLQLLGQAAGQSSRAYLISHYDTLDGLELAGLIDLDSRGSTSK